jgi:hypothetical protein
VFGQVMKVHTSLMLLIICAVVLPGGGLLLPLAYAKYRRITEDRTDVVRRGREPV